MSKLRLTIEIDVDSKEHDVKKIAETPGFKAILEAKKNSEEPKLPTKDEIAPIETTAYFIGSPDGTKFLDEDDEIVTHILNAYLFLTERDAWYILGWVRDDIMCYQEIDKEALEILSKFTVLRVEISHTLTALPRKEEIDLGENPTRKIS